MKTLTNTEFYNLPLKQKMSFTGIIKWDDGAILYCKNGLSHREDGPAYEILSGYKEWRYQGQFHRIDGPAIIDGVSVYYYIYGKPYTKEQHQQINDLMKYKELI